MGTILLEKNRWRPGRQPSYQVSQWMPRFASDGFQGIELWEFHATLASAEERRALSCGPLAVSVYSLYLDFNDPDDDARNEAARMAVSLGARGVKFNVGNAPAQADAYIERLSRWAKHFPPEVRLLSECHEGTLMEEPAYARRVLESLRDPRFQLIVHPFSRSLESLRRWFGELGPSITHAHVQMRDDQGQIHQVDSRSEQARHALAVMREGGFGGSFTLEFSEGVGSSGEENIEALYAHALNDLAFLRSNF